MSVQSKSLYYREGSSDKEYHVSIEPKDGGYVVNFTYGRRGSTLQTGTKTNTPVDLDTATRLFEKQVREKMAKGYTPGADGTPYQHTDKEQRNTGILPQLLNPVDENEVHRLLKDDGWCMQEKFDGKRVLIEKNGADIQGINRKGLWIGLPSSLVAAAQLFKDDFVLDGECIGETLHAFDILVLNGEDQRQRPYRERLVALINVIARVNQLRVHFSHTVYDAQAKSRWLGELRNTEREGVVFKRLDAPYTPGRPHSGGTQVKHKFYATCSAVVAKLNAQRSVELRLLNGNGWVAAGNVTVPPNHPLPQVGDVIEARYLYAYRESGSLFQPTYLGRRTDIAQHECVLSQLKYKAQAGSDEEES